MSSPSGTRLSAGEWLASAYVGRTASRIAYQYSLPPEDAADLLQELWLALVQAGPDARLNATWILQTGMHKAVDIMRRRRWTAIGARPQERENDDELLHLLHARADRLSKRLREFYALRFEHGLSQRETAERLGLPRCHIRALDRICLRSIGGDVRLKRSGKIPSKSPPESKRREQGTQDALR